MKRLLALLVCVMLVMPLVASADAVMSGPGELPIVDKVVEFTIVAPDTTYILPLQENTVTQWILEKTNVKINWEEIPDSAVQEKVNMMLLSDELPDAFMYCGINAASQAKYGPQGTFLPLNDLIEKYGIETKKVFASKETLPGAVTAPDGNIYALPAINDCFHCFYSFRAWINNDWLTKLGKSVPQTTEELRDVLTAFRDGDPNGNGKNDEIAMLGSDNGWNTKVYPFLFNSFLYWDESYLALNEGTVEFMGNKPELKDALLYVRSLIADNLIDPVSLTQTYEEATVIGSDPEAVRVGLGTAATWWSFLPDDAVAPDKRSRQYVAFSPVAGPSGLRISPTTFDGIDITHFVMTKKCTNPDILFRLMDYMYSDEATLRGQIGEEGKDYSIPPEGSLGINGKPALYAKIIQPPEATDQFSRSMPNLMLSNRTADFRLGEMADYNDPETQWASEPRLYNETKRANEPYHVDGKRYPTTFMNPDEADEIARLSTQINDYAREQIGLFLAGVRDIEGEWDAYLNEYQALELDKYVALRQTLYDRQYK